MNRPDRFGWVSRLIHWAMAAAILGMLGLGTLIERMEPSLDSLWMFALYKSVGLTLLVLVLVRLAWHRVSPPPAPLVAGPSWQPAAARAARLALYALMLAVPLTGWIASAATGLDVVAWGFVLPRIAPVSEAWEVTFFGLHGFLTKALLALVVFHVAAALWHAWQGDPTLRRMLRGA